MHTQSASRSRHSNPGHATDGAIQQIQGLVSFSSSGRQLLRRCHGGRQDYSPLACNRRLPPAKNRPDPALKPTTRHYYRQIATSLPKVATTLTDCGTKLSDCQLLLRALASFARMSAMPKSTRPFKRWIFITITCCHTHGAARMISETCLSPAPPATVAAISSLSKKSAYPNPACSTLLVRHGTAWSAFRKSLRQPVQGVPSGSRRDGKRACTQALPAIASTQPPT